MLRRIVLIYLLFLLSFGLRMGRVIIRGLKNPNRNSCQTDSYLASRISYSEKTYSDSISSYSILCNLCSAKAPSTHSIMAGA
jgi:hypothetical protein